MLCYNAPHRPNCYILNAEDLERAAYCAAADDPPGDFWFTADDSDPDTSPTAYRLPRHEVLQWHYDPEEPHYLRSIPSLAWVISAIVRAVATPERPRTGVFADAAHPALQEMIETQPRGQTPEWRRTEELWLLYRSHFGHLALPPLAWIHDPAALAQRQHLQRCHSG